MFKNLWKKYGPNPFDALLRRAQKNKSTKFLICWNRVLGDIPLGLYALTHRIRSYVPQAEVTFATRADLADGFECLENVSVLVAPDWKRGDPFDLDAALEQANLSRKDFDVILEKPDPTR